MSNDDITLKNAIIETLGTVRDPQADKSVLDALLIDEVEVHERRVIVKLLFTDDRPKKERWAIEEAIGDALEALSGVDDVDIQTTTQSGQGGTTGQGLDPAPHSHHHPEQTHAPQPPKPAGIGAAQRIAGVGKTIAVASGKGGVGKSTVAVNLALALSHLGHKVGLLDLDVYGPSLPVLMGTEERPAVRDQKIVPLDAYGLKIMSLGFLMEEDTPVIWRGPIVSGIVRQFLQDVDWAGLDYLILDLPPGTGDAQLSLAQSVPLDGAVIVTTPSDIALLDTARGLQMFRTLKVDVLGVIENMSYYQWPGAGELRQAAEALKTSGADVSEIEAVLDRHERTYIFGNGGGAREAKRLETEFLGEIPLDSAVRKGGDEGKPVVAADPDSPVSAAFIRLARRVAELEPVAASAGGVASKKKKGLFSFLRG
jgi:ATP-binding protein involved in chromosome partitioning